MEARKTEILSEVADYYSEKLSEHGQTPRGVDWNGEESQVLRFEQLTRIVDRDAGFSLNDLGCGYGALLDYLTPHWRDFTYCGCNVSTDMIFAARDRYARFPAACSYGPYEFTLLARKQP